MLVSRTDTSLVQPVLMSLQLFFRTGRLRIVISTANLVEYDWRDIENVRTPPPLRYATSDAARAGKTVWVQDVPKRPSPAAADPKVEDFASAMVRVLHGVNVAPALVNFLKNEVRPPLYPALSAIRSPSSCTGSTRTYRSNASKTSAPSGTSRASRRASSRPSQASTRAGRRSSWRATRAS